MLYDGRGHVASSTLISEVSTFQGEFYIHLYLVGTINIFPSPAPGPGLETDHVRSYDKIYAGTHNSVLSMNTVTASIFTYKFLLLRMSLFLLIFPKGSLQQQFRSRSHYTVRTCVKSGEPPRNYRCGVRDANPVRGTVYTRIRCPCTYMWPKQTYTPTLTSKTIGRVERLILLNWLTNHVSQLTETATAIRYL